MMIKIRTLVVEDEPVIAESIVSALRSLPEFDPIGAAGTGELGIRLARREQPDLVVLDFKLPGVSGFDVWRSLHDLPQPPDVIAVTAAYEGRTVRRAFANGARMYLIKPFTSTALRDNLRRYAKWVGRLPLDRKLDQVGINTTLGDMYDPRFGLPSNLSQETLQTIRDTLRAAAGRPMTTSEVAAAVKRSRVCAGRYLDHLRARDLVTREYRGGSTGHPVYLYRWIGP
jgi:response regulator of citrate/malate metabolism